jgi:isovaleryl-CoA dehydrogenase
MYHSWPHTTTIPFPPDHKLTYLFPPQGPIADTIVVYAKTAPSLGSKGISAFILSTDSTPGFSCTRSLSKLGMRGSPTGELAFSDVFLPRSSLLGPLHGGVQVLMSGLDIERLVLSSGPIGIMQACLDVSLPYIHQRKQFGKAIAEHQLVQGKVADMYTKMAAARAFTMSTAAELDRGGEVLTRDCAAAILFAAERGTECALDAIQLLGGMGYVTEMPAGRLLRDAKLYEIGAGTSEVRRWVIGRGFNKEFGVGG